MPSTVSGAEGGTNTSIGQSTARARVDAAIAALPHDAIASLGRADGTHRAVPASSDINNCTISVKRWRALCDPATLRVSSLTQMPPDGANPSAADSSSARASGVRRNPVPATRATASSRPVMTASLRVSSSPTAAPYASTARYAR
jgi:hypothetical protein